MFNRSHIFECSIPLGIFVLLLLFAPAAHGSFVATHGPVTALRDLRDVAVIFFALCSLRVLQMIRAWAMQRVAAVALRQPRHPAEPDPDLTCSFLC